MCSSFDYASVLKHHDRITVADGGESVGDHEYGTAFHQVIHTFLNDLLGSCIDGRCRLIEDQYRRVCDSRSRDREELSLTLESSSPSPLRCVSYPFGSMRINPSA